MIISRTPYRISFFGGGTDFPDWYLKNGGKVLGTTIDKYCYISCRELPPYFEHKHRIVYSLIEDVQEIHEIKHPAVRGILEYFNVDKGLEVHHDGDIPARSGMGSSSSFTVGLLKCLHAMNGNMITKENILKEALHIEQQVLKENVGSQDQTFAAYGGFNYIEFLKNGEIVVNPIIMNPESFNIFQKKFMLFFTGISRFSSEVSKEQVDNIKNDKIDEQLFKLSDIVDEAFRCLTSPKKDFREFGILLNDAWQTKRKLSSKITTPQIDEMYERAIKAGAVGGKLLGAGGGGFIAFYVEPENQLAVREALKDYLYIPFQFDFTGSEIVVYKPIFSNGS